MKKIITVLAIMAFVSTAIAYSFLNYYIDTDIFAEEKDRVVTFQINFVSSHPEGIDGRYFVKKGSEWMLYSNLQDMPYWINVGKMEFTNEMTFKQLPNITHLAIQYLPNDDHNIINVTGDGNYTVNFDIDGDKKPDHVLIKEVEWDDSKPKILKEFRTNSIYGNVKVEPVKLPIPEIIMNIQTLIDIEKNYPDLLSDEEVDILLSYTIGRGYGMVDHIVDQKAMKIMWKLTEAGFNK